MIDNPQLTLKRDIDEYLQWMISNGYSFRTCDMYRNELNHFFLFIIRKQIGWNDIFTLNTLKDFQKSKEDSGPGVRGLWQYLFEQKRIHQPIDPPRHKLPDPYEDYLLYYNQTRKVSSIKLAHIRRVLCAFHDYLERQNIKLVSIRIEQIDAFLAEFFTGFSANTRKTYRSYLRGFFKFLYYPRKIIRKDLAPWWSALVNLIKASHRNFYAPMKCNDSLTALIFLHLKICEIMRWYIFRMVWVCARMKSAASL